MSQGVRAHPVREARAAGVPLDDLVETLSGEAAAAQVHEHPLLVAQADELRTSEAQIGLEALYGLRPDRDDPLLGSLAAGAQDSGVEIKLGELQGGRLRRAQAACVHRLEQRPVPQCGRTRAGGLLEKLDDVVAPKDVRQTPPRARGSQLGGRIVVKQLLTAQVAVER